MEDEPPHAVKENATAIASISAHEIRPVCVRLRAKILQTDSNRPPLQKCEFAKRCFVACEPMILYGEMSNVNSFEGCEESPRTIEE